MALSSEVVALPILLTVRKSERNRVLLCIIPLFNYQKNLCIITLFNYQKNDIKMKIMCATTHVLTSCWSTFYKDKSSRGNSWHHKCQIQWTVLRLKWKNRCQFIRYMQAHQISKPLQLTTLRAWPMGPCNRILMFQKVHGSWSKYYHYSLLQGEIIFLRLLDEF